MKLAAGTKPAAPAPLPVDPAATARLVAALDVVLAATDKVSDAIRHFSALPPDAPIPPSWVERAAELHVQALEAWWALDDEAAIDAAAGGWTVGPPHAVGTPMERRLIRLRWETELMTPATPELRWDKAVALVEGARTERALEEAGRALIAEGARRRYQHFHECMAREAGA